MPNIALSQKSVGKTGKEHSFDVSGLPTGMYFLKSTSDVVTYDYYRFLKE
ncbi:MAG: hypothetical protein ACPGHV_03235 [Flavobacteriaceae bacterium]